MGILKEFRGLKLGSMLLNHAIASASRKNPNRMWVHTCSLDHKYALKNYKSKGFEVYQVSLDRNKSDWVRGITQDELPWINVSDLKYYQSEAAEIYDVDRIPSAYLLDPDGKIIAKNTDLRGGNLSRKLNKIFN